MVQRWLKQSYGMLVVNSNHIFLLGNEKQKNHLFFFGSFLANVGHFEKVLCPIFTENLKLLSVLELESRSSKISDDV